MDTCKLHVFAYLRTISKCKQIYFMALFGPTVCHARKITKILHTNNNPSNRAKMSFCRRHDEHTDDTCAILKLMKIFVCLISIFEHTKQHNLHTTLHRFGIFT